MEKCFLLLICFFLPLSLYANDVKIIEQGSSYYYFSATGKSDYLDKFNNLTSLLPENLIAGFTRATTKCYFKQLDPNAQCPDFAIGHASMKTGTPRNTICAAAKKTVVSPRGCQKKHCTPCTYDKI